MSSKDQASYRNIMKGTAIFGGTQVFTVIVGIIRGKLVAMILGPVGMGICNLLSSALAPIQQFASLGMPLSAVRDISGESDEEKRKKVIKAFRMMLTAAAAVGVVITSLASGLLSKVTFGDNTYTWSFVALSISVFFAILAQGETTILQGCRRLKSLASRTIIGSTAGLVIGVPLYYLYGFDGIVPAMIILAVVTYIVNLCGTRKIELHTEPVSWKDAWIISKSFMSLGIIMMIAVIFGHVFVYSVNIIIRHYGSLADVGLYQAANSIINQYIGMVFAAMATDYYPHLSSVIMDKQQTKKLVHQQGEIVLYIIAPLAALIIITAPLIIKILLTEEFYPIIDIIRLMGLGVILKAACFPLGYLAMAKGDKKFYFAMDGVWTNLKGIVLFGGFYILWGFKGLGLAVLVNSFIDIFIIVLMNRWRYGITYNFRFNVKLFLLYFATAVILGFSYIDNTIMSYSLMIAIGVSLSFFCYKELDKRMDIRGMIAARLHRNKNM